MSLNDVKMTPALVVDFYRNVLIETGNVKGTEKETMSGNIPFYLGGNQKNILIVSRFESAVHIPDRLLDFLTNILSACKLTIADTAIFNMNNLNTMPVQTLLSHLQPRIVLLFGTGPGELDLPARFPHFQKQWLNKTIYLSAPRLEETAADVELKKKLWACLKNIFNV